MYKGKAIVGKSIDSQGKPYFYIDCKDIAIETFGDSPQEARGYAISQFTIILDDAIAQYSKDTQRTVSPSASDKE